MAYVKTLLTDDGTVMVQNCCRSLDRHMGESGEREGDGEKRL